jgi:hypothetical protein
MLWACFDPGEARHPPGHDSKEIGPDPNIIPIPFAENGSAAIFGKWGVHVHAAI